MAKAQACSGIKKFYTCFGERKFIYLNARNKYLINLSSHTISTHILRKYEIKFRFQHIYNLTCIRCTKITCGYLKSLELFADHRHTLKLDYSSKH